jgi:hypothetical protein
MIIKYSFIQDDTIFFLEISSKYIADIKKNGEAVNLCSAISHRLKRFADVIFLLLSSGYNYIVLIKPIYKRPSLWRVVIILFTDFPRFIV